jgi:hypothetical protein
MGSTLVYTGDRVDNDTNKPVFVIGAYRLGGVLIKRVLSTTNAHPGEGVAHVTTAGGEDYFIIHPDGTPDCVGVLELDEGMVATCATDYTHTTDEPPAVLFHMNFGAVLRNIQFADPASSDVSPFEACSTISGTAGSFIAFHTEDTFVDSDTSDGEAFSAGVVITALKAQIKNRLPLRHAYFLTDPSAVYTDVAIVYPG